MEKQFLSIFPTHLNCFEISRAELSPMSRSLLSQLLQHILFEWSQLDQQEITYSVRRVNHRFFAKIPDFNFYPRNIQETLKSNNVFQVNQECIIQHRRFQLHLLYIDIPSKQRVQEDLHKIRCWLGVVCRYASDECSKIMDIYISFTNIKKQIPSKGMVLDKQHANTAFTYSCKEMNNIHVFREEEWFKCFIHETFHSMGLDFSHVYETRSQQFITNLFHVLSDVRLYESYCEMWAEIIGLLFLCVDVTKSKETMLNNFEEKLFVEQQFSLFQSAKLLDHFQVNYRDLIDKTHTQPLYRDNTPTFSYYIIKSLFMYYIDDFLQWCSKTNKKQLKFLNNGPGSIMLYCKLIQKLYNKQDYMKSLHTAMTHLHQQSKRKMIMKTMRMTIQL